MISIRRETPGDYEQVHEMITNAFSKSELGYHGESELVARIRENHSDTLSLVAVDQEVVVGHVLFSPVSIESKGRLTRGMGLAPMAVHPGYQRSGIGTRLVRTGIEQLVESSCPFVVVLGHPEYYPRFGFQPAANLAVTHGFDGIPQGLFFLKLIDPRIHGRLREGRAIFLPEFGPQRIDPTV